MPSYTTMLTIRTPSFSFEFLIKHSCLWSMVLYYTYRRLNDILSTRYILPYGNYMEIVKWPLSYVIITIYLPNILNHVVSFLVKKVLHFQVLTQVLPVLGVGCAMVTVSLIVCIYYNVIMSYTVYYMVSSFASEVPWSKCDPSWADMSTCYVRGSPAVSNTQLMLDLSTEFFNDYDIMWHLYVLRSISILCMIFRCCSERVRHIAVVSATSLVPFAPSASSYLIWSP